MVNVFEAHGAVRSTDVLDTTMAFGLQLNRQTHIAHFAVEESIFPSNSTDSARVAVILFLVIIVEEVADEASVITEANATFFTVGLDFLTCVALCTDELFQLLSVERVRFCVVVTESTAEYLSAAWALKYKS